MQPVYLQIGINEDYRTLKKIYLKQNSYTTVL